MKNYIGTKIIRAEPMGRFEFIRSESKASDPDPTGEDAPGYRVVYPDDYVSWSPTEVFETAYREVTDSEMALLNASIEHPKDVNEEEPTMGIKDGDIEKASKE